MDILQQRKTWTLQQQKRVVAIDVQTILSYKSHSMLSSPQRPDMTQHTLAG